MARHNELHDRVADLSGKSFTANHVREDPLIFVGCAMKRTRAKPARSKNTQTTQSMQNLKATEHKGKILISDLCQKRTYSVHNMRVMKTDAKSHSAS